METIDRYTVSPVGRRRGRPTCPSWLCKALAVLGILALAWPALDEPSPPMPPSARLATIGAPESRMMAFALSPDGRTVAATNDIDQYHCELLTIGDGRSAPIRRTLGPPALMQRLAFAPDGRFLAAAGLSSVVSLFDLATANNEAVRSFAISGSKATALAFSSDGRFLAVASDGKGPIAVWDLARDTCPIMLHGPAVAVDLQFSPDGRRLAAGEFNGGTVRVWDLEARQARPFATGARGPVLSVSFSPDGALLAAACGWRKVLWIWDAKTGRALAPCPAEVLERPVRSVRYSPDGSVLAVADQTGSIRFWDRCARRKIGALNSGVSVPRLAFSADGRLLAVGGHQDNVVRLWRMRDVLAHRANRAFP